MDNTFPARPKPVADIGENQPESNTSDSTMAVSSMEYNHKMDGQSNPVKMGANDDSANVSSASASASQKGPQTSLEIPQHSDSRAKRKGQDTVNTHTNTSTPVSSQIIHVNTQKPKKGSFQITRVINRKQLELDAVDHAEDGDSIGDDFDETNTEDLSSEIMDTSKTTDIDQDPSSEDTVQSLAIEDLQRENKSLRTSLPQPKDAESKHNIAPPTVKQEAETIPHPEDRGVKDQDANFGATRFRIVKVSNERYLRGRWTCYDYLDSERTIREKSNEDLGSGNSSAASSVHYIPGVDDPTKNPLSSAGVYSDNNPMPGIPADAQPGHSIAQSQINNNGDYSAQSMTSLGNSHPKASSEQKGAHEMPSSIVQSASAITNPISTQHSQPPSGTYTAPSVGSTSGSSGGSTQASQIPSQDYSNATSHQEFVANQQQTTPQQQQQPSTQTIPQQQQQQTNPQPAAVAPSTTNKDFANGVHNTTAPADSSLGDISSTSLQPQSSSTNINDFSQSSAAAGAATNSATAQVGSSSTQSSNASPSENVQTSTDFRPPDQGVYIGPADDQQSTVSAEDDRMSEVGFMKPFMVPAGLTGIPLLEMVQTSMHPLASEDESGASTIAIDNKIEQAMDLVKSHLMFAVREEVEVLKEQIKDLVEKNSQLEMENNVLRANATKETLSQLSTNQPPAGATTTTQTSQGPTSASTSQPTNSTTQPPTQQPQKS